MMTYLPEKQICVALISNSEGYSAGSLGNQILRELSK
ncbi:MAG: hypothetical protein ACI8X5_002375 [Planctomycetota bacterium]|jgi:hypothetical protein